MYDEGGYILVHKHVYIVDSAVFGLQFACTCDPNLVCVFLTCTCASCTRLVCTRELCKAALMSPTLHAHAGLHVCERKNMSCGVPLLHACSVKFKLSCIFQLFEQF